MNLWLRVLHLIIASFFRPKINPVRDVSRLEFRVWPHDLDASLHMNNGRYWTLMDLGRADIMIQSGLWRPILKHGWVPVVSAGQIRFRREMRLFQPFTLETRILTWSEGHVVMEHRLVSQAKDGSLILNAVALVKAGLYDRSEKSYVPIERLLQEIASPWSHPR
jgi:acyl-CoA thioesterase FadM